MKERDVDVSVVRCLLTEQFPNWAELALRRVEPGGWDNTTFRLGADMVVRLPNDDALADQVAKEHRWLPLLAQGLPVAIPDVMALGRPGCGFARPWSVSRWLDGIPVTAAVPIDEHELAESLAGFLTALHRAPVDGGPGPGEHNYHRAGPLKFFDLPVRDAITQLEGTIDTAGALTVWDDALASVWDRQPVWTHGDVTGSNLLVRSGRLVGVIDFGCCAIGDPACHIGIAWTLFGETSRHHFAQSLALDPGSWARAQGWTLWKAVRGLTAYPDDHPRNTGERLGWRWTSRQIIDTLITRRD